MAKVETKREDMVYMSELTGLKWRNAVDAETAGLLEERGPRNSITTISSG